MRTRRHHEERRARSAVAGHRAGRVAAQYILAAAEFVAVSQVMVYIGAVMVLFLFGIMLTRARSAQTGLNNQGWADRHPGRRGALRPARLRRARRVRRRHVGRSATTGANNESTVDIADRVLFQYLAPFFGMTFVLLAAAIGAIVLARKD